MDLIVLAINILCFRIKDRIIYKSYQALIITFKWDDNAWVIFIFTPSVSVIQFLINSLNICNILLDFDKDVLISRLELTKLRAE